MQQALQGLMAAGDAPPPLRQQQQVQLQAAPQAGQRALAALAPFWAASTPTLIARAMVSAGQARGACQGAWVQQEPQPPQLRLQQQLRQRGQVLTLLLLLPRSHPW